MEVDGVVDPQIGVNRVRPGVVQLPDVGVGHALVRVNGPEPGDLVLSHEQDSGTQWRA